MKDLVKESIEQINSLDIDTKFLKELAEYVINREK